MLTELPQRILRIELFLFLFTCALPWGQGQTSAVVPPCAGVGTVPAALEVCSNTALPTWVFAATEGGQAQAWVLGGPWRKS